MEAKEFGGLGKAALGLLKGSEDQMLLGVANGIVEIGGGFGDGQGAVGESFGKVLGKDEVRIADDDGALNGVFEFANVAGPIILSEAGTGGRGKSADFAIGTG